MSAGCAPTQTLNLCVCVLWTCWCVLCLHRCVFIGRHQEALQRPPPTQSRRSLPICPDSPLSHGPTTSEREVRRDSRKRRWRSRRRTESPAFRWLKSWWASALSPTRCRFWEKKKTLKRGRVSSVPASWDLFCVIINAWAPGNAYYAGYTEKQAFIIIREVTSEERLYIIMNSRIHQD